MRDLKHFRKKVEAYYKQTFNKDGNRRTQRELAEEIGLNKDELSKRLNEYEDLKSKRTWHLTDEDVFAIVRTLAKWGAITTQAQALELLELMKYPYISSIDWKNDSLGHLRAVPPVLVPSSTTYSDNDKQRRDERLFRLNSTIADHSGILYNRLESFVGREAELAEIRQRINRMLPTGGYIIITGQVGQGKSSIIAKLVEIYQKGQGISDVAFHFIPFNPGPEHQVSLLRNLMARLVRKYNLSDLYLAGESRSTFRDYFPKILADLVVKGGQEVIFIDGLDQLETEFGGVRDFSFLPSKLPPGVVFVLGTRPNDSLQLLELLKPYDEYQLANISRHDFDLILQHRHVTLEPILVDRFYHVVQENALYLDLAAKELAESEHISPTELIQLLADDPENIFSLATNRFKLWREFWQDVIKPIFGTLLVAQEPLAKRHLRQIIGTDADSLNEGLERLGGLVVDGGQQRYSLFHIKFRDFLLEDPSKPGRRYVFAQDELEDWHRKVAHWCEQHNLAGIWEDEQLDSVEQGRREYARHHYIAHLYHARHWQHLFSVLDAGEYGLAKVDYDPSMLYYARDLELGQRAAAWKGWSLVEGVGYLTHLWKYTLLRSILVSQVDDNPPKVFIQWLLSLNEVSKALELAELSINSRYKVEIMQLIAEHLFVQSGRELEGIQLFARAFDIAGEIKDNKARAKALCELGLALVKVQQKERAQSVWAEAERVIGGIKDPREHARALSELRAALMQTQEWAQAERVIGGIKDPREHARALSELGAALMQTQEWAQAEHVIGMIEEDNERGRILGELGMALAQAQEWAQAEQVIGGIKGHYKRAEALCELGLALVKVQQKERAQSVWTEAEQVIGGIKGHYEHARALSKLGVVFAQAQEWTEAERVIGMIEEDNERGRILGELGVALAQAQEWAQAEQVIGGIKGRYKRAEALCELGLALVKVQQKERAQSVWIEAEQVIGGIKGHYEHARALSKLGVALIMAQQSARGKLAWYQAEKVLGKIKNNEKQAKAFRELMEVTSLCSGSGHIELEELKRVIDGRGVVHEAAKSGERLRETEEVQKRELSKQMFKRMSKWKVDSNERVEVLIQLGAALAWMLKPVVMELVINTIKNTEKQAAVLSEFAANLIRMQKWTEAEWIIGKIKDRKKQVKALVELGVALARTQEWAKAEWIIGKIKDRKKRAKVLGELGVALARTQEWVQAERIINLMESHNELDKIFSEYSTVQNLVQAERTKGNNAKAEALSKLNVDLMRIRKIEQVRIWKIEQARVKRHGLDRVSNKITNYEKQRVLSEWGVALALGQEEAERVIVMIGMIEEDNERDRILGELGMALAQAQEWAQAEQVIGRIKGHYKRAEALCELGLALVKVQQKERAQSVWAEAEQVIGGIKDPHEHTRALSELGMALAQAQEWTEAERVIGMIGMIEEEEDNERDRILGELGMALAQAQEWAQAEQVIGGIKGRYKRAEALCELGLALVKVQQKERAQSAWAQAEQVIGGIKDPHEHTRALSELGAALAQAQEWTEAERVIGMIEEDNERGRILGELGVALAQAQEWAQAEQVIGGIKGHYKRAEALCELGLALVKVQQKERAQSVWAEAEQVIGRIKDPREHARALSELGVALARAQEWTETKRIISTIKISEIQASVLSQLGVALMQAQERDQARLIWAKAQQAISRIEDHNERFRTLSKLCVALEQVNEWEQLLQLVQHSWLHADRRRDVLNLLSLANGLIFLRPEIGLAFYKTLIWVNDFLRRIGSQSPEEYAKPFKNVEHVDDLSAWAELTALDDEQENEDLSEWDDDDNDDVFEE